MCFWRKKDKTELNSVGELLFHLDPENGLPKPEDVVFWIRNNIKYVTDIDNHDSKEYYQTADYTISNKIGDCDDSSIAICVALRQLGIKAYLLSVFKSCEGHMFCIYKHSDGCWRLCSNWKTRIVDGRITTLNPLARSVWRYWKDVVLSDLGEIEGSEQKLKKLARAVVGANLNYDIETFFI